MRSYTENPGVLAIPNSETEIATQQPLDFYSDHNKKEFRLLDWILDWFLSKCTKIDSFINQKTSYITL